LLHLGPNEANIATSVREIPVREIRIGFTLATYTAPIVIASLGTRQRWHSGRRGSCPS
jgi:hypothetical protein